MGEGSRLSIFSESASSVDSATGESSLDIFGRKFSSRLTRFVTKLVPTFEPFMDHKKNSPTREEFFYGAESRVRTCVGLRRGFYRPEYLTTLPSRH